MAYDTALKNALTGTIVSYFTAVEILHPLKAIRLLDGDGFLVINGHTYVGRDAEVGTLGTVAFSGDGGDTEAPSATIGVMPLNADIGIQLCQTAAYGSVTRVLSGAFDPQTGQVVGEPFVEFAGIIDVPHQPIKTGQVTFDCISGIEFFLDDDEGMLLSDAFHQSVWPGELGLQYMVDVELNMPWGMAGQRPELTRANA